MCLDDPLLRSVTTNLSGCYVGNNDYDKTTFAGTSDVTVVTPSFPLSPALSVLLVDLVFARMHTMMITSFVQDKDQTNPENNYNHNFQGLYCTCNRPYPDSEDEV